MAASVAHPTSETPGTFQGRGVIFCETIQAYWISSSLCHRTRASWGASTRPVAFHGRPAENILCSAHIVVRHTGVRGSCDRPSKTSLQLEPSSRGHERSSVHLLLGSRPTLTISSHTGLTKVAYIRRDLLCNLVSFPQCDLEPSARPHPPPAHPYIQTCTRAIVCFWGCREAEPRGGKM